MAIPFFKILPGVLKAVGRILGIDVVKQAGEALGQATLSPQEEGAIQTALLEHEVTMRQLSIDEMKTAMAESLAMIASPDKWVSRARPTGLYIFYLITAAIAIGMLAGVKIDPAAVLTILSPLGGVGGLYVYKRTQEKVNGNG